MHNFEQLLEETDDVALLEDYIKNSPGGKYRLFALALDNGRVEYSFSRLHPLETVVNGLNNTIKGKGCKSWYNEIVVKIRKFTPNLLSFNYLFPPLFHFQRSKFLLDKSATVINCTNFGTAMNGKFLAISQTKNAANIRTCTPFPIRDPEGYFKSRLLSANICKISN